MMNSQSRRKQTMNRGSQALEIPKGRRNLKQITLRHHMKFNTSINQFHAQFPLSAISGFGFRRHIGAVLYRDPFVNGAQRFRCLSQRNIVVKTRYPNPHPSPQHKLTTDLTSMPRAVRARFPSYSGIPRVLHNNNFILHILSILCSL